MTGINGLLGVLYTLALPPRHILIGRGTTINRVFMTHWASGENAREDRKERIQRCATTISPGFFPVLRVGRFFLTIPPALARQGTPSKDAHRAVRSGTRIPQCQPGLAEQISGQEEGRARSCIRPTLEAVDPLRRTKTKRGQICSPLTRGNTTIWLSWLPP